MAVLRENSTAKSDVGDDLCARRDRHVIARTLTKRSLRVLCDNSASPIRSVRIASRRLPLVVLEHTTEPLPAHNAWHMRRVGAGAR